MELSLQVNLADLHHMRIVFRNKKLLAKDDREKNRISLVKIANKIKRLYPLLYEEVGSKNVRKILKAVLRNSKSDKVEE